MSAGLMDQRVKLLQRDLGTSSTGSGLETPTFLETATVHARVQPLRGGESFLGAQRFSEATHRFRIYYREALDTTWRLEWRGQQFDIVEALPAGQSLREWLDVLASASPAENAE